MRMLFSITSSITIRASTTSVTQRICREFSGPCNSLCRSHQQVIKSRIPHRVSREVFPTHSLDSTERDAQRVWPTELGLHVEPELSAGRSATPGTLFKSKLSMRSDQPGHLPTFLSASSLQQPPRSPTLFCPLAMTMPPPQPLRFFLEGARHEANPRSHLEHITS